MRFIYVTTLWVVLAGIAYLLYRFRSEATVKDALEWIAQPGVGAIYGFIFALGLALTFFLWKSELTAWVNRRRDKQGGENTYLEVSPSPVSAHPGLRVYDFPAETNRGALGRGWSIQFENPVRETATGVVANLTDIELENPAAGYSLNRWPKNRHLNWVNQKSDPFEVEGFQTALLDVVNYDYANACDDARKLTIAYREDELRADNYIPAQVGRVILIIRLTVRGAQPIYIACRLDTRAASDLIYQGVSNAAPFEILTHGTDLLNLKDFQADSSEC